MTNIKRLVRQDVVRQADADSQITAGTFRFTEQQLWGFKAAQEVVEKFGQVMGDPSGVPGADMPLASYEKALTDTLALSLTEDFFATVSGIVGGEMDSLTGTEMGAVGLPFFMASGVKPGIERPVDHAADMSMGIAHIALHAKHSVMQMLSGNDFSFRAMYAIVNIYSMQTNMQRVQTTGVIVSLTKGDCIFCADPEKLTFITIPSHLLAAYLPTLDREGNAPGMEAERREATYLRAIASLGARELN